MLREWLVNASGRVHNAKYEFFNFPVPCRIFRETNTSVVNNEIFCTSDCQHFFSFFFFLQNTKDYPDDVRLILKFIYTWIYVHVMDKYRICVLYIYIIICNLPTRIKTESWGCIANVWKTTTFVLIFDTEFSLANRLVKWVRIAAQFGRMKTRVSAVSSEDFQRGN